MFTLVAVAAVAFVWLLLLRLFFVFGGVFCSTVCFLFRSVQPKGYKMRLYVLQALNLTPMDIGIGGRPGKSDPYLRISLGKEVGHRDETGRRNDHLRCDRDTLIVFIFFYQNFSL